MVNLQRLERVGKLRLELRDDEGKPSDVFLCKGKSIHPLHHTCSGRRPTSTGCTCALNAFAFVAIVKVLPACKAPKCCSVSPLPYINAVSISRTSLSWRWGGEMGVCGVGGALVTELNQIPAVKMQNQRGIVCRWWRCSGLKGFITDVVRWSG